jgi:hypothetical protein
VFALTVFILPEIGLNVVLAENSFDWFSTVEGMYTLTALVIRILIDLPCIFVVLIYQISQTKRKKYLKKMLKPLKKNITNGQVLRQYENIDMNVIDERANSNNVNGIKMVCSMPTINNLDEINFEPEPSDISLNGKKRSSSLNFKTVYQPESEISSDDCINQENYAQNGYLNRGAYLRNSYVYRFIPNDGDFSIYLRPSCNDNFHQRFVNIDNIKINNKALKLKQSKNSNKNSSLPLNQLNQLADHQEIILESSDDSLNLKDYSQRRLNRGKERRSSRTKKYPRDLFQSKKSKYVLNPYMDSSYIKRNRLYLDYATRRLTRIQNQNFNKTTYSSNTLNQSSIPIEIKIEMPSQMNKVNEKLYDNNNNDLNNAIKQLNNSMPSNETYTSLARKKLNLSNHHIYLPPAPSLSLTNQFNSKILDKKDFANISKTFNESDLLKDCIIEAENENETGSKSSENQSQITETIIKSFECNCVNILSCDKNEVNEIIHSNDCPFKNSQIRSIQSKSTQDEQQIIQRKHF